VKNDAIGRLDAAHRAIEETFAAMPDPALAWLKPGDDYAIGGIVIHLIQSLDGYIATLEALRAAGFTDTDGPGEDEAEVDAQLVHARRGLTPDERAATFADMRAKHARLAALAATADEAQFATLVGVRYPGDEAPYPTSVALVVQWMTEHYAEHVPHANQLFAEWQKAR
jgi:hypothetical protein